MAGKKDILRISELKVLEYGLYPLFRAYVKTHHESSPRDSPYNSYLISINNSSEEDVFHDTRASHIDFWYDSPKKAIDGIHIRVWPPLETSGIARKLIEAMESIARELRCKRLIARNVTNPGFWRHFNFDRN